MNDERDDLVSKAYRELDDTQAPEHLNRKILQMAAAEAQQSAARGWSLALWMKPIAWAATIGLSLAIVLEMTQVPTEIPAASPAATPPETLSTDALNQAESRLGDELKRAEEMARQRTGSNQAAPAEAFSAESADIPASSQKAARRQSAPEPLREVVAESEMRADADVVESAAKDKLEQAPAATRERTAASMLMADQAVAGQAAKPECDARTRESASDWRECIQMLRAIGATDAAELEFEAYILEFPDEPEPNK